jgi:hypothetical protein
MTQGEHRTHTESALAELERQIAETRAQLGETVEELAARADVPARAKATYRVAAAKDKAAGKAAGRATAASQAAHDAGSKAGAKLNRVSEDQWRSTYLPAAIGVTVAAGACAVLWLKHRGERA